MQNRAVPKQPITAATKLEEHFHEKRRGGQEEVARNRTGPANQVLICDPRSQHRVIDDRQHGERTKCECGARKGQTREAALPRIEASFSAFFTFPSVLIGNAKIQGARRGHTSLHAPLNQCRDGAHMILKYPLI
jgi:hypothetical protein